jgi:hypothetical protein
VSIGAEPVSLIRVKPLSIIGFLPIGGAENGVLRAFCGGHDVSGERRTLVRGQASGVRNNE